ncbi:hypothetical protein O6H91_02G078800 [Diphasiastrum complanatum]|uniref:Uncharacterized protein n=1 Tax=Diphasiastrum complanatum TaxID=34168 RepID=A0ACC2EH94_DIPCM|nr:hypothetical protein O6H91_02G078800 [Diphasiastrum complanatum]
MESSKSFNSPKSLTIQDLRIQKKARSIHRRSQQNAQDSHSGLALLLTPRWMLPVADNSKQRFNRVHNGSEPQPRLLSLLQRSSLQVHLLELYLRPSLGNSFCFQTKQIDQASTTESTIRFKTLTRIYSRLSGIQ